MGAYLSSPLAAAGDAFSSKMAERQKETMAMQREFQRQAMENQMKRQMAMRMASTRETLQWQAGFWSFLVLGVTARYIKTKSVPTVAFVPIVVIPYLMAYQVDLAYGNKADRIYNEANRILAGGLQEEEAHWFTSVKPEESKKKVMTPWS